MNRRYPENPNFECNQVRPFRRTVTKKGSSSGFLPCRSIGKGLPCSAVISYIKGAMGL